MINDKLHLQLQGNNARCQHSLNNIVLKCHLWRHRVGTISPWGGGLGSSHLDTDQWICLLFQCPINTQAGISINVTRIVNVLSRHVHCQTQ
jgi:hypothetical protein